MRLTTPRFWYDDKSLWPLPLLPLSWLYALGHLIHQRLGKPYTSALPVLCIGNLVAGGGGKTPAALAIARLIQQNRPEIRIVFLTRGYGGRLQGPVIVDPKFHGAADIGDEPLLLARVAPTIVAADRAAGARLAEQSGYSLIIMDDGLQNASLAKTASLVVIDGAVGLGNRLMLPAGPLRTPLPKGLEMADGFILTGQDETRIRPLLDGKPVFEARIDPDAAPSKDQEYIAFTGIARPGKFFSTLKESGLNVIECHPYPDHYMFSESDLSSLQEAAIQKHAKLITTEKDFMRLSDKFKVESKTEIFPITLSFLNEKSILEILEKLCS